MNKSDTERFHFKDSLQTVAPTLPRRPHPAGVSALNRPELGRSQLGKKQALIKHPCWAVEFLLRQKRKAAAENVHHLWLISCDSWAQPSPPSLSLCLSNDDFPDDQTYAEHKTKHWDILIFGLFRDAEQHFIDLFFFFNHLTWKINAFCRPKACQMHSYKGKIHFQKSLSSHWLPNTIPFKLWSHSPISVLTRGMSKKFRLCLLLLARR